MSPSRERYQEIFRLANTRLAGLPVARCKEIELLAARSLRFLGPKPPMWKQLVAKMEDEPPSEAFRERAHATLRRLFARLYPTGLRAERFEVVCTAFVDGQPDTLERYLTADIYLRPWGEP